MNINDQDRARKTSRDNALNRKARLGFKRKGLIKNHVYFLTFSISDLLAAVARIGMTNVDLINDE